MGMPGIGEEFFRKTRYRSLGPSEQERGVPQPPLELEAEAEAVRIPLPPASSLSLPRRDLQEAIERRRSLRRYSPDPLCLEELSFLLWCTQGVRKIVPGSATFRTVPSAGARHAIETYLLANRVQGVPEGLYRYSALEHALLAIRHEPGLAGELTAACLDQEFVKASAVTFAWTAAVRRMRWRYGERGYRYLLLDAGHVCQNLYLAAEAVGCGACAIAAFDDQAVDSVLGLDGQEQFSLYLAAVGKK
jgi:SagB-type dehydrogenase family enzyme